MSIPDPHVGLVINYGFLWKSDSDRGMEDGKTRPSCIVASIKNEKDGNLVVLVLPITHSPQKSEEALKIPKDVKAIIGLDDQESWVVCSEVNKFVWPGCDIRPVSVDKPDQFSFGTIPSGFLNAIQTKISLLRTGEKLRVIPRTA